MELLDPEINALIQAITEVISGRSLIRAPHLTVRGAYDGPVPQSALAACRAAMQHDVLRIANVGRFSNPNEEVVYFEVDSPHLRDVWWKPEFSIKRFRFNPHLSLYRGADRNWANLVAEFLKGEKIELLCAEFRFTPHTTKQKHLFPPNVPIAKQFVSLINAGQVHKTFLMRLAELSKRYKLKKKEHSEFIQARLL